MKDEAKSVAKPDGGLEGRLRSDSAFARLVAFVPGVVLCGAIAGVAVVLQGFEERALGHPYIEALVIAILLGIVAAVFGSPASFGVTASLSAPDCCWRSP